MRRSRRRPGDGRTGGDQTVSGSLVFGDVIQITDVTGEVTINTRTPPPYQVTALSVDVEPLPTRKAQAQPSRLLLPRHRIVPFVGRDDELQRLTSWGQGPGVAARLIHAGGGHGKTRLAEEFATHCAADGWAVWRAEHVPTPGVTTSTSSQVALPVSRRALIVVDYADRWPASHLLTLLTDLVNIAVQAQLSVRVLLLARWAGFWWPMLADRLDRALDTDDLALPALTETLNRQELFTTAAGQFAAALEVEHTNWPTPPRLHLPGYTQVLSVHMAALAAVDAHRHAATAPTEPHAVSAYLLRREYAHWQQMNSRVEGPVPTSPTAMRRASYVATLAGPLPRPAARDALTRVALADTIRAADQIIDDHRVCCPPTDPTTVLEALHPDRLGEDFISLTTPGHPYTGADTAALIDNWTLTAPRDLLHTDADPLIWTPAAVTVLVEAAYRWPHLAAGVLDPLLRQDPNLALAAGGTTLARLAGLPNVDPAVLETIDDLLPRTRHIDLDSAAAAITTVLAPRRLAAATDMAERSQIYASLAWRLGNAGQREQALAPAEEAVKLYRQLAEANPTDYLPDLARSLADLGIRLSEVGRREEALTSTEEARSIRRRLTEANRMADLPAHASLAANLGARLAEMGRWDEAVASSEEAVHLYRVLVQIGSVTYLSELALSLNNLGIHLSEVGRRQEAVASAEEAVQLYRHAEVNRTVSLPDLALSLTNLGARLSEVGRWKESLGPTEEAVQLYRQLAQVNPAAHLPHLAGSLTRLGARLSEVGRRQEALTPTEEAVQLYRQLAQVNPAAHLPHLAASIASLGVRLSEVGRREEALAPTEEAVQLYRQLAQANPAAHLPNLASSLANLGVRYRQMGRRKEALASTEEATAIRKRLVAVNSAAYLPDLALSLDNLGVVLSETSRRDAALAPTEEAVRLFRQLAQSNPAYLPNLASSLNNLGVRYSQMGRRSEALAVAEEAVRLFRQLAPTNPTAYLPELAMSLHNLGVRYSQVEMQGEKALALIEEAVQLYRPLAKADPAAYLPDLAESLWMCARICIGANGNLRHAHERVVEAIGLLQMLTERLPTVFGVRLRWAYRTLADVLDSLGRSDEAASIRRQVARASGDNTPAGS
ncbi:tetratricopeptide repeat protein [Kutzneria sp. NPDC051319]|uniref:tetratricopeptide repeat protein n=1 Tax=Kutzneria sp. NPDC051319 TaxID=3155047 RepID=UPI003446E0F7